MEKQKRDWVKKAIINCLPLVVLKCEEQRLEMMFAKYRSDLPISDRELKEDLKYLDDIYEK